MNKMVVFGGMLAISTLFLLEGSAVTFAEDPPSTSSSMSFSLDFSDPVLQMTLSSNSIHLDLTPGITAFSSGSTTATISTNNPSGYTLTVTPSSTALLSDMTVNNVTPTIPTLSESTSESSFPNDKWGYKLTGTTYYPVTSPIAPEAWVTSDPTNGTANSITFAAKVSNATPSGTYSTTLTFQAVANQNSARDIITFNKNNENAGGSMSDFSVASGTTANLPTNTFTAPTGFQFSGWTTTASGLGEDVDYYGDEAPYSAPSSEINRQVTLYAQWEPSGTPSSSSSSTGTTFQRAYEIAYTAMHKGMYEEQHEGQGDYALVNSWPPTSEPYKNYDVRFAMQDMTPEICASVTAIHDDYEALDLRDNKLYHITKMADGSCWMTQNLALDLEHDVTILTHADTDLGWTNLDTTATWNPPAVANTIHFTGNTVPGWDYQVYQNPYSASQGDVYYYPENGFYQDYTKYNSLASCIAANHTDCKHYHSGNYYSWVAAAATTNGDSSLYSEIIAPNSICPAGWRLPGLIDNTSDFNKFAFYEGITTEIGNNQVAINSDAAFEKIVGQPFYATKSGATGDYDYSENVPTFSEGRSHYWTNGGLYWEAAYTIEWAYSHSQGSGWIYGYSWNRYNRNNGINVRCIAR